MFAYCLNNPIMYGDDSGFDAVILYDEDNVGHIGVLLEDENGNWWHCYWGTSGTFVRILCAFGFFVPNYTWCVEYKGNINLDSINSTEEYSGNYEKMYYLEGDFSDSLHDFSVPTGMYNLFVNNCSEFTLRVLAKSDTSYAQMLTRASRKILPANAAQEIAKYFAIKNHGEEYFGNR